MATKVLVTTDGSPQSQQTAEFVVRLARVLPMEILLGHALAVDRLDYKMIPDFQVEMIRQGANRAAEQALQKEAGIYRAAGVSVTPHLLVGSPGPALCDLAQREGVELLVAGRRGQGALQDILFGSVSNYLVHHCENPILVVKRGAGALEPWGAGRPIRALVALDDSPAAQRCLDYLGTLRAWVGGLSLTLVRVVNPARPGLEHLPSQERFEALQAIHREAAVALGASAERLRAVGYQVDLRVEQGAAGRTLCRIGAEDGYDLVVLGRRGAQGPSGALFGSVCHFVIHHCANHVLLVP